jgi:threonyl-tRNA synthetase
LGRELKLFKFSEEVGMGLPLWMPNGEFVRHSLMEYMRKLEEENGYKYVQTPSITKSKIFYTSGHLPHYKDSMYAPIQIEGADYYLKPMNCPFHHEICKELVFSYRDLPLRIAEPGSCYRFELSGTMYGIIRTRNFTQNDSHIYCTPDQVKSEFVSVLKLFKKVYSEMGIKDYWYRLSLPDFEKNPEKYASGEDRKKWEWAAQVIRDAMKSEGEKFVEAVGEAAFYGPKIDVQVRNAFGKDDSISTIQIDVLMAKRFNLEFTNNEGKRENMVIIHRAIMGSFERFIAFLLEQCIGNLPLWLSPVQIAVLPLTDAQEDYARKVCRQLEENGYRVFFDASQEKIEKKIREAQLQKIPYMLVLGKQEEEESKISVRSRDGKVKNGIMLKDFEKDIEGEVKLKKA